MNFQIVVATAISLLMAGLVYLQVPLVEPIVGLVGVFVLPGWLLTSVLFGNRSKPDPETRFVLVFGLGAALVALELVLMSAIGIGITRTSVLLTGAAVSLLLLGALIFRLRATGDESSGAPMSNILLLCGVTLPVLCGFAALHQPLGTEAYTEFYVAPHDVRAADGQMAGADLVIVNHEQEEHRYRVVCRDATGSERTLVQSALESDSSLTVELALSPFQSSSTDKMRLYLYRANDDVPYRWVELMGDECELLR
jgi:uncharacterized membrane protein